MIPKLLRISLVAGVTACSVAMMVGASMDWVHVWGDPGATELQLAGPFTSNVGLVRFMVLLLGATILAWSLWAAFRSRNPSVWQPFMMLLLFLIALGGSINAWAEIEARTPTHRFLYTTLNVSLEPGVKVATASASTGAVVCLLQIGQAVRSFRVHPETRASAP